MNEPSGRTPLRTELRWVLVVVLVAVLSGAIGLWWILSQWRTL